MTIKEHCFYLGALLGHFHTLEYLLRSYLNNHLPENSQSQGDYYSHDVGSELIENKFTNYDSLGMLIDKVNASLKQRGIEQQVDKTLVEIRDALAHGRVSGEKPEPPLRLIKFSKPRNGKVKVDFNVIMTEDWFVSNRQRVSNEIQMVHTNL